MRRERLRGEGAGAETDEHRCRNVERVRDRRAAAAAACAERQEGGVLGLAAGRAAAVSGARLRRARVRPAAEGPERPRGPVRLGEDRAPSSQQPQRLRARHIGARVRQVCVTCNRLLYFVIDQSRNNLDYGQY